MILSEISQAQKDKNYEPTYIKYLEESNSQRQKVEGWSPGTRREEGGVIV